MLPKTHIILGFLFSAALFMAFDIDLIPASIIFLSSFLIDFDHYLYFVFKKKSFSLSKAYLFFKRHRVRWRNLSYNQKEKYKMPILLFHGVEFLFIVFVLSFFLHLFSFFFIGFLFHLIFDYFDILINKDPEYVKLSVIYVFFSNKNKKYLD